MRLTFFQRLVRRLDECAGIGCLALQRGGTEMSPSRRAHFVRVCHLQLIDDLPLQMPHQLQHLLERVLLHSQAHSQQRAQKLRQISALQDLRRRQVRGKELSPHSGRLAREDGAAQQREGRKGANGGGRGRLLPQRGHAAKRVGVGPAAAGGDVHLLGAVAFKPPREGVGHVVVCGAGMSTIREY
jgi:hypothetical protein